MPLISMKGVSMPLSFPCFYTLCLFFFSFSCFGNEGSGQVPTQKKAGGEHSGKQPPVSKVSFNQVPFKRIWAGQGSPDGVTNSLILVKSAEDWKKQSIKITRDGFDSFKVDFKTSQVLVGSASASSGGHGISIHTIESLGPKKPNGIKVNIIYNRPGTNCLVTEGVEYHFDIVVIPAKYNIEEEVSTEVFGPACRSR